MAMHYTISTEKTACGRAASSANATSKTADVTCKTCCKSEAFASKAPTANVPAPASATPAPATQAPTIGKAAPAARVASKLTLDPEQATKPASLQGGASVAFKEWGNRLHSKDRLPRGKFFARQRHHSPTEQCSVAA
uniref:Uncharacterized protein n=1 Tax=Pseudomonas fluorescens (strain SBW25) TaxID=216595 RepID=A0A0G4E4U0_PSEFS|nr:hypothetical protein [Pseudomonas fluorescens]CEK42250.1 hypothetical protein PQBR57_0297 [Pseudomonas fluorescens SBW25]